MTEKLDALLNHHLLDTPLKEAMSMLVEHGNDQESLAQLHELRTERDALRQQVLELQRERDTRLAADQDAARLAEAARIDALYPMKRIEPCTFSMGTADGDPDAFPEEKPQHEVQLTRATWVGVYTVTQQVWDGVMGGNPSAVNGKQLPVTAIRWFDACKIANALSKAAGVEEAYGITGDNVEWKTESNGYRLPTEAEWECAARAGQGTKYAGSNNPDDVAWYDKNSGKVAHQVGQKKPNGWGLYDMSGNVWEWCWDCLGAFTSASAADPVGAASGPSRVRRGGSWVHGARYARIADRRGNVPSFARGDLGVRLVRFA